MPSTSPLHNQPELTVSQLSAALKRVVEDHFGLVRVRGEISGFKRAASGHLYFDLKDENAVLNSVCWKGSAAKFAFKPEDGLEVICRGKISTYPGRSNYQLIVDAMEPAGVGALMALLEKRKAEMQKEGLFDPARKRPLPYLPQVIGVVTSPTGAVIKDILHRLRERFPVHVVIWPVLVQGEGAAEQITNAINGFNAMPENERPDVIIVARGGGSMEDLWAFNEENVVRAAAGSKIPLISAVGHETDTTLIDYVSDKRAPTPTAAAEIAVPVKADLQAWLLEAQQRTFRSLHRRLSLCAERIESLARGLPKPKSYLDQKTQRLDEIGERLTASRQAYFRDRQKHLLLISGKLAPEWIVRQVYHHAKQLENWAERQHTAGNTLFGKLTHQLELATRLLGSMSYQNVLKRGFALVRDASGKPVASQAVAAGMSKLTIEFRDGDLGVIPAATRQGSLFDDTP